MSDNKKPLTVKSFLFKAGTKAANSADAFLKSYRNFLENGELAYVTAPILAQIDAKEVFPTPGLELIKAAVLAHHIEVESRQAEARMNESPSTAALKNWTVSVYDSKGNLCTRVNEHGKEVELEQGFLLAQDAAGWADRRLVQDCASDCFAVIIHNQSSHEEVILRDEAMGRIFRAKKGPMTKKTGNGDNRLSWGVKAKQSHASFSRG